MKTLTEWLESLEADPVRRAWFAAEVLFLIALAVYLPSLHGGFQWDDNLLVLDNPHLRAAAGLREIWFGTNQPDYFPLTSTTFWLEWQLWGRSPFGYRVVNVILHAASAVALWRVLLRLRVPGAWLGAVLYAVHPVCVPSVAWISERKNVLAQLPALLAVLGYCRWKDGEGRKWYAAALFFFLLALLAKSSVVMLPAALLLLGWWRRSGAVPPARSSPAVSALWAELAPLAPFFLASLGAGAATLWFQHHRAMGASGTVTVAVPVAERLVAAGRGLWFYIGKQLAPAGLAMIYPKWEAGARTLAGWLPLAGYAAALLLAWKERARPWCRAVFLFLSLHAVLLLPVLGFVPMAFHQYSWAADHLQYVALPAGMALAGAGLYRLAVRADGTAPAVRLLPAGLAILALTAVTLRQAWVFGDAERIWRQTLRVNPSCWAARNNLAAAMVEKIKAKIGPAPTFSLAGGGAPLPRLEPGTPEYRQTEEALGMLREAARTAPKAEMVFSNMAGALQLQGRLEEALEAFRVVVAADPKSVSARCNLGSVLEWLGRPDAARTEYEAALRLDPGCEEAHFNLANALMAQGLLDDAAAHYDAALRLLPNHAEALVNSAVLLARQGHLDEAQARFEEAARVQPEQPGILLNLGVVWLRKKQPAQASVYFQNVLEMTPDNADARVNLAVALASQGRLAAAAEMAGSALRLTPADPATLRLVLRLWGDAGRPDEALRKAQESVRRVPDSPVMWRTAGEALLAMPAPVPDGVAEAAREFIRRADAMAAPAVPAAQGK